MNSSLTRKLLFILILFSFSLALPQVLLAQTEQKHRVIILTDIEADPDDTQSLIRFLLYTDQWDVEGLIATTSIHQKKLVAPASIVKVLDAYRRSRPNLLKHRTGYPTYEDLKSKVKSGPAVYGMHVFFLTGGILTGIVDGFNKFYSAGSCAVLTNNNLF